MGVLFASLAGVFSAVYSYFMRRSVDASGSCYYYNFIQFFTCAFITFLLGPFRTNNWFVHMPLIFAAIIVGIFLGLVVILCSKALEKGPPALIFAIIYSAAIIPGVLFSLILGKTFGFELDFWSVLGLLLVVFGLAWASKSEDKNVVKKKKGWKIFAILAFICQSFFLTGLQWRALLIEFPNVSSPFMLFVSKQEAEMEWFLPVFCLTASLIQFFPILINKAYKPKIAEVAYGFLGGSFNSLSIFFIMLAAIFAQGIEKLILFPLSSVVVIILCGIWGQILYKEKVKWVAYGVSLIGILLPQTTEVIMKLN
jgi:hypothetical protein